MSSSTPIPLTTEEMCKALEAAGKRVKSNATDDDIAMAHLELEAEQEAAGIKTAPPAPPVDEQNPPAPPAPPEAPEIPGAPVRPTETIDDVIVRVRAKVMAENKRDYMGDKEPEVVAWARENLTKDEFDARYAGRLK